jgi:hypothetical protein
MVTRLAPDFESSSFAVMAHSLQQDHVCQMNDASKQTAPPLVSKPPANALVV